MCGIVSVVGAITQPEREAFIELLHYDAVRGWDSTGVFNVMPDGTVDSYKLAEVPTQFLRRTGANRVVGKVGVKALVGHNRAATKGAVNDENAHPFEHDHIIGVHNGTLRNQHSLPQSTKFVVDSDNLFHAMSNEDVRTLMPKVNGAFALVWHDANEAGSVYVLRNNERPLWYARNEAGTVVFMASEYQHINAATCNNRVKIKLQVNDKGHSFFQFKEDTLYKVRFDGVIEEVCAIPAYTFPQAAYSYQNGYDDYGYSSRRSYVDPWKAKEKDIAATLGMREGYSYTFVYSEFEKYAGSNVTTGTLRGYCPDTQTIVQCFGVRQDTATAIAETGSFSARFTHIPAHANKEWLKGTPATITVADPVASALQWKRGVLIEDGKVIEVDFFSTPPTAPWILSEDLQLGDTHELPKLPALHVVS